MRKQLRSLWKASQPALRKPRLWVALSLRKLLRKTTFIAITGSSGKSTATHYLAAILSSQAPTQWTRLNRNTEDGFTETLAFCATGKTRYAVFEVGAGLEGGMDKAIRIIQPHISVVLTVFLEHRSLFKSIEGVAHEKEKLLSGLPPNGLAVLNADDPMVAEMTVPAGRRHLRFGSSAECQISYENAVSAWPQMLRFTAIVDGQRQEIRTRLLGTHWVGVLLACIAVAHDLGVPLDQIARTIEEVPPYPGRMQVVRLPSGAVVIRDEFKGHAHSTEVAFEELRKATAERRIVVYGDVAEAMHGPRTRLRQIGRKAAELADFAIFVGEEARHGADGAKLGGLPEERVRAFPGYSEAADFLKPLLRSGDVVLFKADHNKQLPRLFFSLLGTVSCTLPACKRPMVCDDCSEFQDRELVQITNEELTVLADGTCRDTKNH